jgi:hypothetical protein
MMRLKLSITLVQFSMIKVNKNKPSIAIIGQYIFIKELEKNQLNGPILLTTLEYSIKVKVKINKPSNTTTWQLLYSKK